MNTHINADVSSILEKNRIFHSCHIGERCFILACGPSIKKQELKLLKGEICFAVSNFFVHPDFDIIRPQYYCVAAYHQPITEEAHRLWLREAEEKTGNSTMFFSLSDWERNQRDGLFKNRQIHFLNFSGAWNDVLNKGIDITLPVPSPQSVTIMALMAALYMGFKEVYLLGCDHSWLLHMHETKHFYNESQHVLKRAGYNEWLEDDDVENQCRCYISLWQQYKAIRNLANRQSIKILNATEGGMLDVFPRVDYNSLFTEKAASDISDQILTADDDLSNIKSIAQRRRAGNWQVRFSGLTICCHDLLSFYMAGKDIFLQRIYNVESSNPSPVIIDGGGHIGLFTLFAKQRYPNARITVFEPDDESWALLNQNIEANRLRDITVIKAGLYKHDGEISFASDHSDGSSIFTKEKNTTTIKVVRLSEYIQSEIDFLKLNIEGAELDVFTEIEPKLPLIKEIVIEYHGFPEVGQNLHKILAILDRSGFRYMIHDFDEETNPVTKPPFQVDKNTRFFLLIYAKRLFPVKQQTSERALSEADNQILPVSALFGSDRGTPIDRYYIEKFLETNSSHIHGRVLEIGDNTYTRKYGSGVTQSDVLNYVSSPNATIVGDLATGENIPVSAFDCIIMTQTIQFIYDVKSALQHAFNALKPSGVILLTASGISQISRYDMDRWGEYWRFTDKSLKMLLSEIAPEESVYVDAHGNVAVAKSFLDGRGLHEIPKQVLDYNDKDYQVVLTARVHKKAETQIFFRTPLALIYHRVADDVIDAQFLSVSPINFEAHLKQLAHSYHVLPLHTLLDEMRKGVIRPNTVAITFDDGYLDNLTNAVPLLEKYGLHASIFVTSGMVGSEREFWWDAMERIFFETRLLPNVLTINHPQGTHTWDLTTPQGRLKAYDELSANLRSRPVAETDQFVNGLLAWAGLSQIGRQSHRIVNPEQLRQLAASPYVEIGSHTVSHSRLSVLPPDQQRQEIFQSKQHLESIINKPVRLFSYPFGANGDFTEETVQIVIEAGYEAGIANIQGNITSPVDLYAIPRRLVRNWTGELFSGWLASENKDNLEVQTVSARTGKLTDCILRLR